MKPQNSLLRLTAAVLTAVLLFCCGSIHALGDADGFVRTDGTGLICRGKPFLIKGISMGNDVWSNPASAPVGDHDEASFREIAALGFNCVRFYLNYALFESDDAPGQYRQEGFDWVSRNIGWAKKHGIRLILNMHVPQGGYQSQGGGDRLWTDRDCQERLTALWGRIAEVYADEETVIGYGLVNEPMPVGRTDARDGLRVWQELAQETADRIRLADKNHIIFVEKVLAVKDPDTGETDWSLSPSEQFVTIRDSRTVYEFHTYDPHAFTHQGFDWAGTGNTVRTYPDDSLYTSGLSWLSFSASGKADTKEPDWQYLETGLLSPADSRTNVLALCFQAANIGKTGAVYADNLWIDEFDENGKKVRSLPCETAEFHGGFTYWSQNGAGSGTVSRLHGADDKRSICIRGATDDANMTLIRLSCTVGHRYRVRGYVRAANVSRSSLIRLRLDEYQAASVLTGGREMLEHSLQDALAFSGQSGCPVYCGEFGAGIHCFEEGRGGERWVADILDLFREYGISFNYHSYYDGAFGLYFGPAGKPFKNEQLERVFRDHL